MHYKIFCMTNLSNNSAGIIWYVLEEYMTHLLVYEVLLFCLKNSYFSLLYFSNSKGQKEDALTIQTIPDLRNFKLHNLRLIQLEKVKCKCGLIHF
jgi:hypothetical protein